MIELSKGTVMERRQQLFHERGNWFCRKKVCYHTLVSGSGLKPDVMCFCTAHQDKISFVERIDAAFYDVAGISGQKIKKLIIIVDMHRKIFWIRGTVDGFSSRNISKIIHGNISLSKQQLVAQGWYTIIITI